MGFGRCLDCGNEGPLVEHHIVGKKVNPDNVVKICPNCHYCQHNGIIIVRDNKASRKWRKWVKEQAKQGNYMSCRPEIITSQLESFGYVPMSDGWENWEDTDDIRENLVANGWL